MILDKQMKQIITLLICTAFLACTKSDVAPQSYIKFDNKQLQVDSIVTGYINPYIHLYAFCSDDNTWLEMYYHDTILPITDKTVDCSNQFVNVCVIVHLYNYYFSCWTKPMMHVGNVLELQAADFINEMTHDTTSIGFLIQKP